MACDANADDLRATAERLYARFITTDSEELINCSGRVTRQLEKYFGAESAESPPPRDLFDGVLKCLTGNLRGNIARYLRSAEFKAVSDEWGTGYATKQRFTFRLEAKGES